MNTINWNSKDLIVFDLDNTLSPSKAPIDKEMAILLTQLLDLRKIAVISGGNFNEFKTDLIDLIPSDANFSNLHLFPMDGTAYMKFDGKWKEVFLEKLSSKEKEAIKKALEETLESVGFKAKNPSGEIIEDRESSIVFSALGQHANLEDKQAWDPDKKKRFEIKKILDEKLSDFEVNVAGTTSIDITAKGRDKAYGIIKMVEYIKIPIEKMIFIGDALFPGGNDQDVIRTGIQTQAVSGPEDTKKIIKEIISKTNQNA